MNKSVEKQLSIWLKQQKSACGKALRLSIFLGIANGLALVCQAYYIAFILHGVIIEQRAISSFSHQLLALAGLIVLRAIFVFAREKMSFEAGRNLRMHMRQAVLNKLETLGPVFIQGKPVGSWATIVFEQIENLQDFYSRYLPQMSLVMAIPLIILVAVFPLNWAGGLILLVTAPLIPLFMILVGWGAADANRKHFTALSRLSGYFLDRLQGLASIKLFYQSEAELKRLSQASEDFRSRTMSVLRLAFLSSAVLEFFAAVSIAVLAVYFGFSYLGHLDFGHYGVSISLFTGMFVLILAPEFYQPLRDLGNFYHAKAQAIAAAESLMQLLNQPEPKVSQLKKVSAPFTIEANELSVQSFNGKKLLGPVTFSIQANAHIGLVGPSGAGKTSLLQAILGFLPIKGELLINGISIEQIDKASLRKQLAWLGQLPQLFYGSVSDNVALAQPNLSHSEIHSLLNQAGISDFVLTPSADQKGLDYPINEHAGGLSVGQAQRIALARALSLEASLYLLDEPTASLDSYSEAQVVQALFTAWKDKSCLMITHKLELLTEMDNILVMDKGQIVEQGDFTSLSEAGGLFSKMLQQSSEINLDIPLEEVKS